MHSPAQTATTLDQALDVVESLPDETQADLVHLIQRRLAERRHERVVESVRESREEHARGESRRVTVAELMAEIRE